MEQNILEIISIDKEAESKRLENEKYISSVKNDFYTHINQVEKSSLEKLEYEEKELMDQKLKKAAEAVKQIEMEKTETLDRMRMTYERYKEDIVEKVLNKIKSFEGEN